MALDDAFADGQADAGSRVFLPRVQSLENHEYLLPVLPVDADASAERLRAALRSHLGVDLGVVVTDTFGRPWREGQVEVALGVAGIEPLLDLRGTRDLNGHELRVTVIGVADELAGAAGLVMGKSDGVAAVIVRGWQAPAPPANADPARPRGGRALIRRRETDLFR